MGIVFSCLKGNIRCIGYIFHPGKNGFLKKTLQMMLVFAKDLDYIVNESKIREN